MIETRHLKNVVIFIQTILNFVLSRKIIIKDIRDIFRLKKEVDDNIIKNIRNPFRLKKENEAIKDRITREISNLFELK